MEANEMLLILYGLICDFLFANVTSRVSLI